VTPGFGDEIAAIRARADGQAVNPEYRARWFGLNEPSVNFRAQQMRAFGALVGAVTPSLAAWRILDVGCGSGYWLRAFCEWDGRAERLVGIDVSDARFDVARARNPSIALLRTDGVTLPFRDACFDLVTQFVVFSGIPSAGLRRHVAGEMARVLRPGGFVFWWDHGTSDPRDLLRPSEYFEWPIRQLDVGELPRPSECVRAREGIGRFLEGMDRLGYPATHRAALIGPKP
jgi:SAM-dependent methyltransferase